MGTPFPAITLVQGVALVEARANVERDATAGVPLASVAATKH